VLHQLSFVSSPPLFHIDIYVKQEFASMILAIIEAS
jgi:hypothetical protein